MLFSPSELCLMIPKNANSSFRFFCLCSGRLCASFSRRLPTIIVCCSYEFSRSSTIALNMLEVYLDECIQTRPTKLHRLELSIHLIYRGLDATSIRS